MSGEVMAPTMICKHFSRDLPKPKKTKKTSDFEKRWYNDYVLFRNKGAWMTTFIFKDIIDEFEKKMTARNQKAIIVLDNFSGHLIDFSQYKNVSAVFFKTTDDCTDAATRSRNVQ